MSKRLYGKKTALLAALALVLALGSSVPEALAYFTTYVTARGEQILNLGWETEIHEEYDSGRKIVGIENTGELDCYVRVRAFAGDLIHLDYSGGAWIDGGDGYWYYNGVLPAGGMIGFDERGDTDPGTALVISIGNEEVKRLKEVYGIDARDYDVTVVQECAPVQYDEDGSAILPPPTDDAVWAQEIEMRGEGA